MSLRSRLLLALGAVAIVALVAADVVTYSSLRSFLLTRVDQELQQQHQPVEDSLSHEGSPGGPGGGGPSGQGEPPGISNTFVEVISSSGQSSVLSYAYQRGSRQYSPKLPAEITGFSSSSNPGGEPARYFNTPAAQTGGPEFRVRASLVSNGDTLVLATPLTDTNSTLHRLFLIELAVTGGALILAGLIGWWLVQVGLRPLRDIERTAGAIAEGRLDERVPGEKPTTEVGRLAGALNVMLGRIQDAFRARDETEGRLRRFVADASHELRTPLAAVSAYSELFERGANQRPGDLARVMTGIQSETARMGHLVEDLLLLARMDEHQPMQQAPVELVGVAGEAVQAARAVGPEWPVRMEASGPVEVIGDRARLRQVFDNFLSNVRSHTPPGTTATIGISKNSEAVIEVTDNGPGITPEQAERLFERFYRVDPSRSRSSGGAGLGLSIVEAIVTAHGGTVKAAPAPGGGAMFTIHLPISS